MAKFKAEAPTDLIEQLEKLGASADVVFGKMTEEAASEVLAEAQASTRWAFKDADGMLSCLKMTRTYRTPSDDGVNTKVGFYGYFINRNGVKTPAPMVANVAEYGSSRMPQRPFFRKCFNRSKIEAIMKRVEDEYLPKE